MRTLGEVTHQEQLELDRPPPDCGSRIRLKALYDASTFDDVLELMVEGNSEKHPR